MFWIARRYWRAGDRARDRGAWAEAQAAYSTAIRLHPRRAGVWVQYGHALREGGDLQGAVEAYRRAVSLAPDSYHARAALLQYGPRTGEIDRLGYVMLGTTGLCNASCIHCPTNKTETMHVPRVPMPMPLFHRIIDELAASGITIYGQIAFGLFGDALIDPHVMARARYMRERFPDVTLSINTNGAGFDLKRHQGLLQFKPVIALHCESLQTATFDSLMSPLRLERVMVKYEQILAMFGGLVRVSVPVHRQNQNELAAIRQWFEARGASVYFAPLMSRCAEDRSLFERLSIAPSPMGCSSAVLEDLSIDCDGTILGCCQDFAHDDPIGHLGQESLLAILNGTLRAERMRLLDEGRHDELRTCSRCFVDPLPVVIENA